MALLQGLSADLNKPRGACKRIFSQLSAEFSDDTIRTLTRNPDSLNKKGQAEVRQAEAETQRYEEDTKNRKILAHWTFWIISFWLIAVVALLAFNFLPPTVYITLLTTTTVNIIGLPAIVLHGYFTPKK